ncbi:MAG TPA: glycosyltransferase family 39 protein [Verrucomicrobiae bacterium]|nr:glycosyltransferase family 39 protein [Verrucomicrobiae bacterium]
MHWLQSLDIALFHFVNGSLSNFFFDWLMPLLSGGNGVMAWFVPIAVIAGLAAIFFGNLRLRLCVLMILLVVVIGDPLIVNTIKHAVARPRPCIALPDVIERLGCTHSGSMPSAHAANWFAATMIALLFYRRSLWFMLPPALAVSFSRVYCGVHYPSDVLAGDILGAGYAVAIAVAVGAGWRFFGKKFFPAWQARLPSLLNPKLEAQTSKSEIEWLRLGYFLIVAMLIGRWLYIQSGVINLSQDEAYQWVWSKHLALSYYSKPPGIALIQFTGTHLFGDTEFGVRFFPPLFAAILSFIVFRFLVQEAGARVAFYLLLVATAVPLLGVGAILMTIDSPLVLCWTWAILAGWRALQSDGKLRDWLAVGLATGLAFLCKYNAIYLILCFGIFFALWPPARIHLRRRGPWFALLIFLICTLPIIIWNSQHGWITMHHVAGNAGLNAKWKPTLRFLWDYLFSEFALLNPVFFIGAIWAMFAFWKQRREHPLWLYFFCMSAPILLGHLIYSLHSRILPNWIAPAILPAFILMGLYWNARLQNGSRLVKPFLAIGLLIGFFAVAILYDHNLVGKIAGQPLPGERDPSHRVREWKQAVSLVEAEREKLQAQSHQSTFILCDHYGITGLFSFYLPAAKAALHTQPLVYSALSDQPVNQFYFWPEYDYRATRKGENAIYAEELNPYSLERGWFWKWLAHEPIRYQEIPAPESTPETIADQFQTVTDLGIKEIKSGNRVLHRIHLWACYNLK